MPIIQTSAYGSVEGVFKEARAIINDMLVSQAGEILTDSAPFMFPMLNRAATYFELEMANNGVKTFTKETVLTPLPACTFTDPGLQVNVSDTGYFDGTVQHYPPSLPSDLLAPQLLWERQTGVQEQWVQMTEYPDGLPSLAPAARFGCWEWRQEAIYMPGAIQSNDLRLRYEGETAQFSTTNDTIMIRGAQSALASYLAALFVASRNPQAAAGFAAAGDDFTKKIVTSNVRAGNRMGVTRISYGRGRTSGPN